MGVFPQGLDAVAGFATREEIPFPILADPDRQMTRDYGVYVRFRYDSWNTARPSVILIDPEGFVRKLWVGSHQLDWPVTADFWAVIDGHQRSSEYDCGGRPAPQC